MEDAIGQVTTLEYAHASDPTLLTKVTDPFGRFATLGYDAEGRLSSITDAAGMTSTFTYTTGDFIRAMTTPYGTTSFRHEPGNTSATYRVIEAVDPVGGRERLEFTMSDTSLPGRNPAVTCRPDFPRQTRNSITGTRFTGTSWRWPHIPTTAPTR